MLEKLNKDAIHRMDQAVEHVVMELTKVRTGRANPDLLNSIQIDYYGSMMPLNQVSTISVPEPRLITLQPFEKSLIADIEKLPAQIASKPLFSTNFADIASNAPPTLMILLDSISALNLSELEFMLIFDNKLTINFYLVSITYVYNKTTIKNCIW